MASEHWMRCRRDFHSGRIYWVGVSYWTRKSAHSRLLTEQQRSTRFYDEKDARRWARKYGILFPAEPEEK